MVTKEDLKTYQRKKLQLDATRLQVEFGIYTGYQHFIRIPIRSRTLIEDCAQKICRVRMHGE